jgi:hypothetical protein
MFSSKTLKMAEEAVNDQGWVGFVCEECGAPLAVHRPTTTSKTPELSSRGWRVTCTGCGVTEYYELGTPMVRIIVS